ncbi:MAG: hypothetical protein K5779_08095 [Saccharofermentans sp.]|nr:hypothetical protein [Saccharofermentans sp.]
MNIIIRDDQGLDTALMMDGYTREQQQEAKQVIRRQFRDTAHKVFEEILGRSLPDTIIVNMSISDRDEIKGESAARLASFNVELSRNGSLYFGIREITVKTVLDHSDTMLFESTVIHEMFHAADLQMLGKNYRLFDAIRENLYEEESNFNRQGSNKHIALLGTLSMLHHYRAEGIAILGESLLVKSKFGTIEYATKQFCKVFELTMMRAQMRIGGNKEKDVFDKEAFHQAYAVAPIILLLVLDKRGDIKHEQAAKALDGLTTGNYNLTDDEVIAIMRSALALGLTGFIQGLTNLGDNVAPIRPFLDFCASVQQDGDEDNKNAYQQLLSLPQSEENYNAAMDQIMGCCMSGGELDELYTKFKGSSAVDSSYPQMKEEVDSLYSIFKNDENPDRQRLAQWALTYFFDDEDIIHDDVSGLGLIDDMTIIDYATRLLQS